MRRALAHHQLHPFPARCDLVHGTGVWYIGCIPRPVPPEPARGLLRPPSGRHLVVAPVAHEHRRRLGTRTHPRHFPELLQSPTLLLLLPPDVFPPAWEVPPQRQYPPQRGRPRCAVLRRRQRQPRALAEPRDEDAPRRDSPLMVQAVHQPPGPRHRAVDAAARPRRSIPRGIRIVVPSSLARVLHPRLEPRRGFDGAAGDLEFTIRRRGEDDVEAARYSPH